MSEWGRRDFLMASLAAAIPNYRIIDPHVHVWKHDPQFPWAKETAHPPDGDATPEMLLALMKQHGVERTVLIQFIGYRWDNSFVAGVLKRYPKYFRAVCRVDPSDTASPDHLTRLVEEQGFRGVRLSPAGDASGDWIRGPLMPPLWERCSKLKVPMTILAIVIDHMADCPIDKPQQLDLLLALERYPKLFVKISHTWSISKQSYPYADAQQFVKRLYEKFGPQRLMWATDWPIVERSASYTKALTVVRDEMKFLNAEDKRWILSKTIERVWPFD